MILILVDQSGPAWTIVDQRGPEWTSVDQCGPVWTSVDQYGPVWTSVDQCGPVWTSVDQSGSDGMTEINARTLMFNLGPADVIDSTTLVKIARYADRKQLTYKITKKGTLLLDGRGKKIHLRKGVVTLRNALDLHALSERIVSRYMLDEYRQSRPSHDDNIVLNTETNVMTQTNMLHVRNMALVDPRLLKSLHENTTHQPPVDKILHDSDAEVTSILGSDADASEKVRLYNQVLLRYNEMTKMRDAKPTPVVVMKSDTVDNVPATGATVETAVVTAGQSTDPANIVGTLPKTLQEKGRQLLSRLSKVAWNERGELMHEGVAIPASNAVDLVHDLLRSWLAPVRQTNAIRQNTLGARRQRCQAKTHAETHTYKTPPQVEICYSRRLGIVLIEVITVLL